LPIRCVRLATTQLFLRGNSILDSTTNPNLVLAAPTGAGLHFDYKKF